MSEFEPISLNRREQMEILYKKSGKALAEYAFNTLWLWREQMQLTVHLEEEGFLVKENLRDDTFYMPLGNEDTRARMLDRLAALPQCRLLYLTEEDAQVLENRFPGRWQLERAPHADEYLCDIASHRALVGRDFANLRRLVHKMEREQAVTLLPLDEKTAADAEAVIDAWGLARAGADGALPDYEQVDRDAIANRKALGLFGLVLYADGIPMGVAAGYPLCEDTFDLAICKTAENRGGASYYIKRALMLALPPSFTYVNLEEDMGIPGLRRMKESMLPAKKQILYEAVRI